MGIMPVPHRIIVMMKELEEFRENFMGKCGFEAGPGGPREEEKACVGPRSRNGLG